MAISWDSETREISRLPVTGFVAQAPAARINIPRVRSDRRLRGARKGIATTSLLMIHTDASIPGPGDNPVWVFPVD
jgi:hypothetical protein